MGEGVGIWRLLDGRFGTDGVLVKWRAVCRKIEYIFTMETVLKNFIPQDTTALQRWALE